MAAFFSTALIPESTSQTSFVAWATWLDNVFISGGWVNTADTGQTLPSALIAVTSSNQSRGYRVYRMDDALQSTAPVFVKLEFGSGNSTSNPSIWLTIGTGSNGTGGITGIIANRLQISSGGAATYETYSFASAASNRIAVCPFVFSSFFFNFYFSIERTKNVSGADTGDGLLLATIDNGASPSINTRYLPFASAAPPADRTFRAFLPSTAPSQMSLNVPIGLVNYYNGTPQQPGLNNVVVNSTDFADYARFSINLYGASHTYQHLGSFVSSSPNGIAGNLSGANNGNYTSATGRLCMLFE